MLSLYEILKASKTGIAPDMWTALAGANFGGAGSGAETKEITGIPPLSIRSNGTMLLDYLISGNMSQSGTPTPQNPVMPQGTGERTGNLFDWNWLVNGYHLDPQTGLPTAHSMRVSILQPIDVSQLTSAILSYESVNVETLYAMYSVLTTDNTLIRRVTSVPSGSELDLSGGDKLYIAFYNGAPSGATAITKDNITNIMLNTGSTALPYEPYGVKIPISSGGENLFIQKLTGVTIASSGQIVSDANYDTYIAEVSNGETYTVSNVAGTQVFGFFTTKPALGAITYNSSRTIFSTSSQTLTVPTGGNIKYIGVRYNTGVSNAMLNLGSEPLPYSPYNRTTTPIYLGEVETTRKIKKYEFTGTESISSNTLGVSKVGFTIAISDMLSNGRKNGYCTHFVAQNSPSGSSLDGITYGASDKVLYVTFSAATATAYNLTDVKSVKTWLSQQYAAGTPVTVWYVLAEPTTGIVNEPLRKIGDYADTLSMEQAGVQIPTNRGNTVIDVETTLKPSQMYIKYQE